MGRPATVVDTFEAWALATAKLCAKVSQDLESDERCGFDGGLRGGFNGHCVVICWLFYGGNFMVILCVLFFKGGFMVIYWGVEYRIIVVNLEVHTHKQNLASCGKDSPLIGWSNVQHEQKPLSHH